MANKYKYVEARQRPWNNGETVLRHDVTGLSKPAAKKYMIKISEGFPEENFQLAIIESNTILEDFASCDYLNSIKEKYYNGENRN